MMASVTDEADWQADELEMEREHGRRVAALLESRGRMLEEQAELLMAVGAISIEATGGTVRAWLSLPRLGQSGYLRVTTDDCPADSIAPWPDRGMQGPGRPGSCSR